MNGALFNDAVSSLAYMVSNDRITDEQYIGKDLEGRGRGIIQGPIVRFLEGLRETKRNLSRWPVPGPKFK